MAQLLKSSSPVAATLREGESYMVEVGVTNQTFRAGQPWEATLEIVVSAAINGLDLIPYDTWTELFAADEAKDFESTLNIPAGTAGMTGAITASVFDPLGNLLASATQDLIIEAAPVIFACPYCEATISAPDEVIGLAELVSHQQTCEARLAIIAAGYEAPIIYTCPYCDWIGYYEWDFWRHKWYHRPDIPKPEKYACHYCRSIFGTASELMSHIRSVHGLPAPTPTPEDAAFHLWDLSVSAVVGQLSRVYLRIINYGGDTGEYSITATIDDQTSTASGKLTPAEQGTLEFTFTPSEAGTYTITANGFTGSFEVKRPRGTLTVLSWNVPTSSPPGTISCSVTYQVTGYVEWGQLYIGYGDQPGQLVGSIPVSEGTYTIPFSFYMPSDGYQYMRCYAVIEYGVWYEWSASAPGYFNIYLEE